MKLTVVTLLLLSSISYAQKVPVALGVEKQNDEYHLLVHDFNEGDLLHPDSYGIHRYGFGRGQLEIGSLSQVYAENRSGLLFGQGLYKVGFEPAMGKIYFHDTLEYQWEPGLSAGIGDHNGSFAYYLAPRAGFHYATNGNDSFSGAILCMQYRFINTSYIQNNYFRTKDKLEIADVVISNKLNMQYQIINGVNPTYMLGFRFQ